MKYLQKIIFAIVLIIMFSSCNSGNDAEQILSNPETKMQIMLTIADDSELMKEILNVMKKNPNSKLMLHDQAMFTMKDHNMMYNLMKEDPGMMDSMMTDMMKSCKNDSTMMASMCKSMMEDKQMMDMMKKMEEENMNKNQSMDTKTKMNDKK
jgi:hypothetical protein